MNIKCLNPESGNPLCVCGVVDSPRGRKIEKGMLEWLLPRYKVYEVLHDGSKYEYPALRCMQLLCHDTKRPCLYIHTRGAFNRWRTTKPTHRMWEHEFGERRDYYFSIVDTETPSVACPFTGEGKETFYNGFVANAAAMDALPDILPDKDRMKFEYLFRGTDVCVHGTILNDLGYDTLQKAREYLYENYV